MYEVASACGDCHELMIPGQPHHCPMAKSAKKTREGGGSDTHQRVKNLPADSRAQMTSHKELFNNIISIEMAPVQGLNAMQMAAATERNAANAYTKYLMDKDSRNALAPGKKVWVLVKSTTTDPVLEVGIASKTKVVSQWKRMIISSRLDDTLTLIPDSSFSTLANGHLHPEVSPYRVTGVDQVFPANTQVLWDLTELGYIHEPAILHNLKIRALWKLPYTFIGEVLVSINPLQECADRDVEILKDPHPKTVAERALRKMRFNVKEVKRIRARLFPDNGNVDNLNSSFKFRSDELSQLEKEAIIEQELNDRKIKVDQVVIISGESGSGKTEAAKRVLAQLVEGFDGDNDGEVCLQYKIRATDPILEELGNALTEKNANSSRFGKFLKIFYTIDEDDLVELRGAGISTYLLERSRVVQRNETEKNFRVFYSIIGTERPDLIDLLGIEAADFTFRYLSPEKYINGKSEDQERFTVLNSALLMSGFNKDNVIELYKYFAAILHIGNIEFRSNGQFAEFAPTPRENSEYNPSKCAANLMGIPISVLEKTLLKDVVKAGKEAVITYRSVQDAKRATNSLSMKLYQLVFDWIVYELNKRLVDPEFGAERLKSASFVGILDIFGFEVFNKNGLETLLINYANEVLQIVYTENVLISEGELFKSEGVWEDNNIPRAGLFEQDSVLRLNTFNTLFRTLDNAMRVPSPSDQKFLRDLRKKLNNNAIFPRAPRVDFNHKFLIRHFAATVEYTIGAFLERNDDSLPKFSEIIQVSTNPVFVGISHFTEELEETERKRSFIGRQKSVRDNKDIMSVASRNSAPRLSVRDRFRLSARNNISSGVTSPPARIANATLHRLGRPPPHADPTKIATRFSVSRASAALSGVFTGKSRDKSNESSGSNSREARERSSISPFNKTRRSSSNKSGTSARTSIANRMTPFRPGNYNMTTEARQKKRTTKLEALITTPSSPVAKLPTLSIRVSTKTIQPRRTVANIFKQSVGELTNELKRCGGHYIRCVKPNAEMMPPPEQFPGAVSQYGPDDNIGQLMGFYGRNGAESVLKSRQFHRARSQRVRNRLIGSADVSHETQYFDSEYISRQLHFLGVFDTVRILKMGYPTRIPFKTFTESFAHLIKPELNLHLKGYQGTDAEFEQEYVACLLHSFSFSPSSYRIGKTKVFFKTGELDRISQMLDVIGAWGPGPIMGADREKLSLNITLPEYGGSFVGTEVNNIPHEFSQEIIYSRFISFFKNRTRLRIKIKFKAIMIFYRSWKRNKAARVIQTFVRKCHERDDKIYKAMLDKRAIQFQRIWRGHMSRKLVKRLRLDRDKAFRRETLRRIQSEQNRQRSVFAFESQQTRERMNLEIQRRELAEKTRRMAEKMAEFEKQKEEKWNQLVNEKTELEQIRRRRMTQRNIELEELQLKIKSNLSRQYSNNNDQADDQPQADYKNNHGPSLSNMKTSGRETKLTDRQITDTTDHSLGMVSSDIDHDENNLSSFESRSPIANETSNDIARLIDPFTLALEKDDNDQSRARTKTPIDFNGAQKEFSKLQFQMWDLDVQDQSIRKEEADIKAALDQQSPESPISSVSSKSKSYPPSQTPPSTGTTSSTTPRELSTIKPGAYTPTASPRTTHLVSHDIIRRHSQNNDGRASFSALQRVERSIPAPYQVDRKAQFGKNRKKLEKFIAPTSEKLSCFIFRCIGKDPIKAFKNQHQVSFKSKKVVVQKFTVAPGQLRITEFKILKLKTEVTIEMLLDHRVKIEIDQKGTINDTDADDAKTREKQPKSHVFVFNESSGQCIVFEFNDIGKRDDWNTELRRAKCGYYMQHNKILSTKERNQCKKWDAKIATGNYSLEEFPLFLLRDSQSGEAKNPKYLQRNSRSATLKSQKSLKENEISAWTTEHLRLNRSENARSLASSSEDLRRMVVRTQL